MKAQAMTANRLDDGAVVYLDPRGCWIESLSQAAVAEDAEACQALETEAARAQKSQLIVGPYLFAVALDPDGPRPLGQREIIRAAGPTVGTDFAANSNVKAES